MGGAAAVIVKLANGQVLGAQVPVHVHRAQVGVGIALRDRHARARVHAATIAGSHVRARLLERLDDVVHLAGGVDEVAVAGAEVVRLLALARVDVRIDLGRIKLLVGASDCEAEASADGEAHGHRAEDLEKGRDDSDGLGAGGGAIGDRDREQVDEEDQERRQVAEARERESVVIVERFGEDDLGDELVVARPLGREDGDREEDDDEEASGEDTPNQCRRRLAEAHRDQAGECDDVEDEHQHSHGLGDEAERHRGEARHLELLALEEGNGVLKVIGCDHGRQRGDHRGHAQVCKDLLERRAGVDVGPREARLVVVEADAVRRPEKLIEAVVETLRLQGRVGHHLQMARILELDHGRAIRQHNADKEGNDGRNDDGENVHELGVRRHARGGDGDITACTLDLDLRHLRARFALLNILRCRLDLEVDVVELAHQPAKADGHDDQENDGEKRQAEGRLNLICEIRRARHRRGRRHRWRGCRRRVRHDCGWVALRFSFSFDENLYLISGSDRAPHRQIAATRTARSASRPKTHQAGSTFLIGRSPMSISYVE